MLLGLVLLYVGAVLFINGLSLLGRIDPREAAMMNLFTGGIALLACLYNAFAENGGGIQAAAYGLLFSFTYLWVAYNNLTAQDGRGLGWFSFFVAVTAGFIAYDNAVVSTTFWDIWLTLCWGAWAVLWFCYFVLGVYKPTGWQKPVAVLTIVQAIFTAWLPGYLLLSGHMPN